MADVNLRPAPPNLFRPRNASIPYFRTEADYNRRFHVPVPAGDDPARRIPWLVEPGMQSIEVYESILARTLASSGQQHPRRRRLRTYICTAGLVQPRGCFSVPRRGLPARADPRQRQARDVCFTLLSHWEDRAVRRWLWAEGGVAVGECALVATPLGAMMVAAPDSVARTAVCVRLGFGAGEDGAAQFPRSTLPLGVLRMGCAGVLAWAVTGGGRTRRCGLAYRDRGFRRVHWFTFA